jgi:ferritin-like metal-binding protein YciE
VHVIDAAIIAEMQRIEHYEITAYGSAKALAESLGLSEVVRILSDTLDEEKDADRFLTDLAEVEINPAGRTEERRERVKVEV